MNHKDGQSKATTRFQTKFAVVQPFTIDKEAYLKDITFNMGGGSFELKTSQEVPRALRKLISEKRNKKTYS